ncbi:MAG: iron-only hydrogenase system regulator [Firmicutes bacterium]|nr:iron-only hydrogenase system regulator [Bacillota bacterium]
METKIALIGIIVENAASVDQLNALLHDYADSIIGRMGLPYGARKINIISIALDAPTDVIEALAAKICEIEGVSAKTVYSA